MICGKAVYSGAPCGLPNDHSGFCIAMPDGDLNPQDLAIGEHISRLTQLHQMQNDVDALEEAIDKKITRPSLVTIWYLAGPMAGYVDYNQPAFHAAATQLRNYGLKIINPAEYGNLVTGWQQCMKRDIHALLWCDAVITMPWWIHSRGATLEVRLARDLEMPVHPLSDFLSKESVTDIGAMIVKLEPSAQSG